jgi:outer membrane receptor for ferrienterochelin and colicin
MRFNLYFFLSIVSISFSQSTTISGVVKSDRGELLAGTNVFIEGTLLGAATNISGKYTIEKIPSDRTYKITAMYIGHRTMTKEIETKKGQSLTVDFELVLSLVDLDEVVVAASFSERKKRAQASPVTIISQDDLRRLPVRSIDEVLSGRVPGGYANLPSRPGQNNYAFTMRGGTSGAGRPLGDVKIYIDGIELLGFDMQSEPGIADFIDPDDIERIEVVRGPMGSTLHGSNAQSGIIHIFTKKGSNSNKTRMKVKLAQKIIEAPILNSNAIGREAAFSISGGSASNVSYNLGFNNSTDEEVMPSNGKGIEQLKVHGSINARIGPTVIDVKTYHSWGRQGFFSNLYHLLEYKEDRSWVNAPAHWDDALRIDSTNGGTSYYKPGFSLNVTHSLSPDLYQSIVIGNDSKRFLYKKSFSGSGSVYLTENWNRYTLNYFWHYKNKLSNYFNVDLTAGTQRTISNHIRLSGDLEEEKDQYYYEDFDNAKIVDQSNKNSGYYAELVADYNDRMFLTLGERMEQNEYFGKDYGTHYSPRIGFSYISEIGGVLFKSRAAWGSGGINPPQAMQALPSESSTSKNIGNPDLRPERQSGYELGGDFYFGDNFFVEVTYFDQLFLDGISSDRSIDDLYTPKEEYQYVNLGQIINKGWEIATKIRLGPIDISGNYSILDSRWGEDTLRQSDPSFEGFYDKGTRRNDVPQSTGNLSLAYSIPGFSVKSKKGGSVVLDINYIGKKKGRDWLLYYDGFYNPDIPTISYYSRDLIKVYDPFTSIRLRFNYLVTKKVSVFMDIRNLTGHSDISRSITAPALGRQVTIGLDLEL